MEAEGARRRLNLLWWLPIVGAVLGLVNIAWNPFVERQFFGIGAIWSLILILLILAAATAVRRIPLTPKELALVMIGFLMVWLLYSPCVFVPAIGEPPIPRPFSRQIVNLVGMCILLVPAWGIAVSILLRRMWWLGAIACVVQSWMSIIVCFLVAGFVDNAWL